MHPKPFLRVVLMGCLCMPIAILCAQDAKHALTNDDIRTMAGKGFSDEIIVGAIEANEAHFDVSVNGLMSLKDGGVSDKVIAAMLKAESQRREDARNGKSTEMQTPVSEKVPAENPASSAMMPPNMSGNPMGMAQQIMSSMGMAGMGGMMGSGAFAFDPKQLPVVTLDAGEAKQSMRASFSQMAQTETKGNDISGSGANATRALSGLASQALSFAAIGGAGMMAGPAMGMAMGMMEGMGGHHGPPKITHVWALAGHVSENTVNQQMPRFEVTYGNLLGIDPDSYEPVIVKLVQTRDNWRLVGATKRRWARKVRKRWRRLLKSECRQS